MSTFGVRQRFPHKRFLLCSVTLAFAWAVSHAQTVTITADVPAIKVGDRWKFETRDRRTGVKESELIRTVTAVTASQIEGTENNGKFVATLELSSLETPTAVSSGDARYLAFLLELGKKWEFKYDVSNKTAAGKARWQVEAAVVGYERIKVPAGEFDTFRIEYKGFFNNSASGKNGRLVMTNWYAPAARNYVKREFDDTYYRTVTELVEYELQP